MFTVLWKRERRFEIEHVAPHKGTAKIKNLFEHFTFHVLASFFLFDLNVNQNYFKTLHQTILTIFPLKNSQLG